MKNQVKMIKIRNSLKFKLFVLVLLILHLASCSSKQEIKLEVCGLTEVSYTRIVDGLETVLYDSVAYVANTLNGPVNKYYVKTPNGIIDSFLEVKKLIKDGVRVTFSSDTVAIGNPIRIDFSSRFGLLKLFNKNSELIFNAVGKNRFIGCFHPYEPGNQKIKIVLNNQDYFFNFFVSSQRRINSVKQIKDIGEKRATKILNYATVDTTIQILK